MDGWYEDGNPATEPEAVDFLEGENPFIDWLVNAAWKTNEPDQLVRQLLHCLQDAGMSVSLLRLIIRTLHPQLFAMTYSWREETDEVSVWQAPHSMVLSEQYQERPFAAIINGEG
tara:strand:- start:1292 stop:1636 length:345 start_codon:yes stop_codon:yes gene_type:complete